MPKPFSDGEREAITAALLEHGHRLFATQGLRKTSVEELTEAVGISKGAFYLFFTSKEELYFTLLEQYEANFQAELLRAIAQTQLPPRARMEALLERAVAAWRSEPLFTRFSRAEYELLLRRLPPERVAAHLEGDDAFAATFANAWAAAGTPLTLPSPTVSGLIKALFFVSMHDDEFSPGIYPAVMRELVTMLAARLLADS